MNGALVIPLADPLAFPAPPAMVWALLLLTFFLHLIPMNFVLGGSIVALTARLRGGEDARKLGAWFGKVMPTAVAGAITFGVAPLLFLQALYGQLFFSSAIVMAWFWFSVVPILILAYYGAYIVAFRQEKPGRLVAVISGAMALMFLSIAFIYSNNMTLMLRPETFRALYLQNSAGVQLNLGDPTLYPRYLHMVLGAIALAGLAVSFYGLAKRGSDAAHGTWAIRHGALWFVVATGLNVLVGFWWLGVLPREVIRHFMGGSVAATIFLAAGILTGLGALLMMNLVIGAREPAGLLKGSLWSLLLTLVLMILSRDQIRAAMMAGAGFEGPTWVVPQWDVIAVFAVLLVGALATTVWMALLLFRPREDAPAAEKPVTGAPIGGAPLGAEGPTV
jgi:hypothetical protein